MMEQERQTALALLFPPIASGVNYSDGIEIAEEQLPAGKGDADQ